jgi:hypothetical protein
MYWFMGYLFEDMGVRGKKTAEITYPKAVHETKSKASLDLFSHFFAVII